MKQGFWQPIFLAFIFVGCTVGPVYKKPDVQIPCDWHSIAPLGINTNSPEELIWWENLQDPQLNELMCYAAAQNLDLKIAAIRILQARSEANGKKGDLYPHIDGSVNYGHAYLSKDALVNGLLRNALPKDHHVKRNFNFYEVGFDADWEIDFFGLTAHEIAALKAHEEAVQESFCGVWVTLSAEIAKNYIELRGFQQRLDIMKKTIGIHEETLQLTEELRTRGIVNDSEYSELLAEWSALQGELPPVELNIARAIHRISLLLGYPPGDLFDCLHPKAPLPTLPCELSIGIPSELLRRRPDIKKAERELAAATERVGSAIAALFPRFSLRGFIGDISTHAGSLFKPSSTTWLAGPQVLIPIFNSRLLLQDVEYNKLVTQEALYTYQKTVLEALEESENAIASFGYEQDRLNHLNEAYHHHLNALAYAAELYQKGINDNFAVTKVKKSLLAAEDIMIQSQVDLLLNYISLYKSLGGSWSENCCY
jgi:outer membrane protein, multidrug efflux system